MNKLTQRLALCGCLIGMALVFDSVAQPVRKPATFLLDATLLQANKQKIRQGDPAMTAARQALLTAADQVLTRPAHSVMEKSKTPPSGSKHDYMSVGPYWWPDTTKPNGLPYIRKDGQINPERSAIVDETYLKNLCDDVPTLALAYYYSDNEKYARRAAERLRIWFLDPATKMNPNLNYGQAIPGITEGRGIGLIDSRGLANLTDAVQLLQGSKAWSQQDHRALQGWVQQFMDWMLTSPIGKDEEDEHNNHGTYYDVQTVAFALFLDNRALARQMLEQKTMKRIQTQLKPDGSQPHELARTLSWNYSIMNLKGFFTLAQLAETVGVDLWKYQTPDGKSIRKAYEWLVPYARQEKPWTFQQIKPLHYEEFAPVQAVASQKYGTSAAGSARDTGLFALTHSLL
ncbi:hypothetical protein GGR92_003690 [Spirosoma lacussanchae]|uniref:alginate lyase family protein n=1 Tax=Spirosoma lacussanchae TaxID=1884249 RepID=UPI0011096EED|nr:alginate lyase family protein [Spirosoma lacussanchae]